MSHNTKKIIDIVANFWSKVEIKGPDECWPWKAYRKENGYGQFFIDRKPVYAHRMALNFSGIELKPGENACHKCDNPPCCNPNHLFPGTTAENVQDKVNKGRQLSGENNPVAILTWDKVREIRSLYESGNYTYKKIAVLFDLNPGHVGDIIRREIWKEPTTPVSTVFPFHLMREKEFAAETARMLAAQEMTDSEWAEVEFNAETAQMLEEVEAMLERDRQDVFGI